MTLSAQLRPDTELQGAGGATHRAGTLGAHRRMRRGWRSPAWPQPLWRREHISGPMRGAGTKATEQHPGPALQSSRGGWQGLGTAGRLTA